MNKIQVTIKKNKIIFSKFCKEIDKIDCNNTNIINTKNLKFTEDYIKENDELIASFFNLLIIKENVNVAIINNLEIAETILNVIKHIDKITEINFGEDKELNYTISALLLENNNISIIECYSMPEIMLKRFNILVKTRNKIPFKSLFMEINGIETYSNLVNKEKIIIDKNLTRNDVDEIIYFFKNCNKLKKIIIKSYNQNNLIAFLNMLNENNLKNINIVIEEEKNTTDLILKDISLFTKLNKKYNVNIKVKYSKEYKEKNGIKEINLILFRNIILVIIIFLILFILIDFFRIKNDNNNTKQNIKNIIEHIESNPNLDKYNNLLKLNSDTIGFIKINNTQVDYPVVQSYDNDYYLKHSFDKSNNRAGWIFVDYRNDMDKIDKNTIIYGHNMKNNIMFGSLKDIVKDTWLNDESNYIIKFNIKGKMYFYKIFSIYVTSVDDNYLKTDFTNEEFINYINKAKKNSIKDFNVVVSNDDKILTLSTCYSKKRLVVHAKMLNN